MLRICFVLAALAAFVSTASAQPILQLDQPRLLVDDVAYGLDGVPLEARPFTWLVLTVPGTGTYKVSTRPFRGATQRGTFRGNQLSFRHDGRTIRLRSNRPMLHTPGEPARHDYPAYVQYDRFGAVSPFDTAHLALSYLDVADLGDRHLDAWGSALEGDLQAHRARYETLSPRFERLRAERARLDAELDGFSEGRARYLRALDDYTARQTRLEWMRRRIRTDRDRRDYADQVRALTTEGQALEREYQRLLWVSDHLGDGFARHEAALYALSDETAAMSAEANALAAEHLRFVVARDRFTGLDVTMVEPHRRR